MLRFSRMATLALVVTVAQACGGKSDDDGGGPVVRSGLPPAATLESLSPNDALKLCEAELRAARSILTPEALCRFFAALFTAEVDAAGNWIMDQAACLAEAAECIEEAEFDLNDLTCDAGEMTSSFAGCGATVQDYERCSTALIRETERQLAAINCTRSPTTAELRSFETYPSECAELERQCPQIGYDDEPGRDDVPNRYEEGPGCTNTCIDASDGYCDDGGPDSDFDICAYGTDCNDCGPRTDTAPGEEPITPPITAEPPTEEEYPGCTNTCRDAYDGVCDDGGEGSQFSICPYGTDCDDCGPRTDG
jgi:hypothetical protein